jgi:hypothetical protein
MILKGEQLRKFIVCETRRVLREVMDPQDDEVNYSLRMFPIEDYDIDGRYFNFKVDYDSEDGPEGINFLSVVETFDPMADVGLGGPPEEIAIAHQSGTLPKGWKFNSKTELLEHTIDYDEFVELMQPHLKSLDSKLYEIAKEQAKEI